jgi:hypothetical protein
MPVLKNASLEKKKVSNHKGNDFLRKEFCTKIVKYSSLFVLTEHILHTLQIRGSHSIFSYLYVLISRDDALLLRRVATVFCMCEKGENELQ